MATLEINPRYRGFLQKHRLRSAADFLALPSVIIGGHPDRHVARVTLGSGPDLITAYLKREHRVLWRERLGNALAGFGLISHSRREARLLQRLKRAGVGCPDWIAAGEDDRGQAFLLVRALDGATELRQMLRSPEPDLTERRRLARCLGETVAHMHEAGFDHPNLYSKHILVGADRSAFHFLDWQRSRRRAFLSWPRRWRNLAALHATLADELAGPRERLAFLRAYLRNTVPAGAPPFFRKETVRRIRHQTTRQMRHRHVRELRRPPLPDGTQQLIWLDGEALCVTPAMENVFVPEVPSWLTRPLDPGAFVQTVVSVPGVSRAALVRRSRWSLGNLWNWLRRRPPGSPEQRQASRLYHLERNGIPAPRLLAYGHRHVSAGRVESFLLFSDASQKRCEDASENRR